MEHLKYCIAEILAANELLKIPNSSFYSRSIGRIIAVRNDDFIKSAFRVNKANGRSQQIKDNVNALQSFFKDHLKIQRDKFGAHFQELDLVRRLESWQAIDYESIDFFTEMPAAIYTDFASFPDYEDKTTFNTPLPVTISQNIKEYNELNDLEKYPTAGVDSLALSRPNTGGMITFSAAQNKVATLKSIEIIIKYNSGLLTIIESLPLYSSMVKKMLINDIVSYADNLISRTDIVSGAPQDEKGLNTLAAEDGFTTAEIILENFLDSFKFHETLNSYRSIRNKCCGHIDVSVPLSQLINDLNGVNFKELLEFYGLLKDTLAQICSSDIRFKMYLIEPGQKLNNAVSINGLEDLKSFDGLPYAESVLSPIDINSTIEYKRHFERVKQNDAESLGYFYKCFAESSEVQKVKIEYKNSNSTLINEVQIRNAHIYFSDILSSDASIEDKKTVLKIFQHSSYGYPDALLKILLDTYSTNSKSFELKIHYMHLFGDLCQKEHEDTVKLLSQGLHSNNLVEIYNSALSLLKIEVNSLRNQDKHTEPTKISNIIIRTITALSRSDFRIVIATGLLSHIYFNNRILYAKNKILLSYIHPLKKIVEHFINSDLKKNIKNIKDKRWISRIASNFNKNKYSTFYADLSDFYKNKKNIKSSENYRQFLYEGLIIFDRNNYAEMHNYAYICYNIPDVDKAIETMEKLVSQNPSNAEIKYELLKFYRSHAKYQDKFEALKASVLDNFKLNAKLHRSVSNLNFNG